MELHEAFMESHRTFIEFHETLMEFHEGHSGTTLLELFAPPPALKLGELTVAGHVRAIPTERHAKSGYQIYWDV